MGLEQRTTLAKSSLYAFGTHLFFRTGFVNQSLALVVFETRAFVLLWKPNGLFHSSSNRRRYASALFGWVSLFCHYSGGILLALIGIDAWWCCAEDDAVCHCFLRSLHCIAGALPGILILWQYPWASLVKPLYPPRHWMSPIDWNGVGCGGVGGLIPHLLGLLLVDSRFGLVVAIPIAPLAFTSPWTVNRKQSTLPGGELAVCLALSVALILSFGTEPYSRLQWVTDIRDLVPTIPFVFLALTPAFLALPRIVGFGRHRFRLRSAGVLLGCLARARCSRPCGGSWW